MNSAKLSIKMSILKEVIENLVEAEMNVLNTPVVYFDMDGVLAGFDQAVDSDQYNLKAKTEYQRILKNYPEFQNMSDDEVKQRLSGPQSDPGLKALKKAWNYYKEKKYQTASRPGFFLNLPVLPGAREMLVKAAQMTGRKPSLLTAPMESSQNCEEEKRQWAEKNFAGLFDNFICTQDKHKYANADAILIDDRTKYTSKFENAGGIAILHKNPADSMQKLENLLKSRGLPV